MGRECECERQREVWGVTVGGCVGVGVGVGVGGTGSTPHITVMFVLTLVRVW